jgi:hypothetical protein
MIRIKISDFGESILCDIQQSLVYAKDEAACQFLSALAASADKFVRPKWLFRPRKPEIQQN